MNTQEWIQSKVDNIIADDPNAKVKYNLYGTYCKVTSKGWVHRFDDSTNEKIVEEPYKKDKKVVTYLTLESTPRSTVEIEKEERASEVEREEERKVRARAYNLREGHKIAAILGFELSDYCKIELGSGIEGLLEWNNDEDRKCRYGPLLAVTGSTRDNSYTRINEIEVERKAFSKYITFTHYTDVQECTSKTITSADLYTEYYDWLLDEDY